MTAKRIIALLLVFCLLISLISCSSSEEEKTAEGEMSTAEKNAADEAALAKFIKEYREGLYAEEELFRYENLSEYYTLGEYKGLTYPDDKLIQTEVSEEEIQRYMTYLLISNTVPDSDYTAVGEGEPLQEFDVVTVDTIGVDAEDGKEYENAN